MRPEEVEKLLAGYATGTLDEAERRALMEAALERQDLFDALAEQEALRELLADPRSRRQLLELLGAGRAPLWRRALGWATRPAGLAALASSAAALVLVSSLVWHVGRRSAPAPVPLAPPLEETTPRTAAAPPAVAQPAPAQPPQRSRPKKPGQAAAGPSEVAATPSAAPLAPSAEPTEPLAQPAGEVRAKAVAETSAMAGFLRSAQDQPAPLLRYSILKDGVETSRSAVFRTGDSLVLRVETEQPGRLLVFRQEGENAFRLLFPGAGDDDRIAPGARLTLPLAPRLDPGEESLVLVLLPETADEAAATLRSRDQPRQALVTPGPPSLADPRMRAEIRLRFR